MSKLSSLQRFNQILLAFLLLFSLLHFGASYLIPIFIAALFAMLLVPVCRKLESWGFRRILAALTSVISMIILLAGVIYILIDQLTNLVEDLPQLNQVLSAKLDKAYGFITEKFNLSRQQQHKYMQKQVQDTFMQVGIYLKRIIMISGNLLFRFILVMVFTTMFLIYRRRLRNFIFQVAGNHKHTENYPIINAEPGSNPGLIITKITEIANSYIAGVFLVVLILSVINTIGLMVIGIEHALFFGLLAGILNIIPYIGSISGSLIPMFFALLTTDSFWTPLIVGIFFLVVQLTESYFITPNITGAKIRLNPMVTVLGLLLGGFIWGIAGMILFIPYLGILKVIFDHVEKMKPYGYLLGKDGDVNGFEG